ncbi:MAG: lipid-binding SYLF domain-containing protein [Candidatus Omnitrophota bacterium]
MKKVFRFFLVTTVSVALCSLNTPAYAAGKDLDYRVEEAADIFGEIMQMPDKAIPVDLLKNCAGVAIFPSVLSGGFIIGGRFGNGVILAMDEKTKAWSAPAFCNIGGLSYGFQIGGQAIDLVLIIGNKRGLKSLLAGKVTLGGDLAVSAGPVGRNAEAATDILLKTGVLSYSRSRGLFAGVAFKGAMILQDDNANEAYYNKELSSHDILFGQDVKPTPAAIELIKTLDKYSK